MYKGDIMSSFEYLDLCIKAQKNIDAKYQVYVFDIVNSKDMNRIDRIIAHYKMVELMYKIYNRLKYENNVLVDINSISGFGVNNEPFCFADTFGFTVYRDSIKDEDIIELYNKYKNELNIDFDFHINSLYYETNKYEEGGMLFFRGYAIDIAANLDKKEYSKIKKML